MIKTTHCSEMNDEIFDIDINMDVWDIATNVIGLISFHLFHGMSSSTI
jgi:hypothetical protein